MAARQVRQRPISTSQLTTGTFSYHASWRSARGAGRRRPHDRPSERQPVDADVQEAADDGAEESATIVPSMRRCGPRERPSPEARVVGIAVCGHDAAHDGGRGARLLGIGISGDFGETMTRPFDRSRTASRSDRREAPATTPAANERHPVGQRRAGAGRRLVEDLLQLVDLVERVELGQAALGVISQPVDLGRLPDGFHMRRDDCAVAAVGQGRWRRATAATTVHPVPCWRDRTSSAAAL